MFITSYFIDIQAPEPEVSHVQVIYRNLILTSMGFLFTLERIWNPHTSKVEGTFKDPVIFLSTSLLTACL